MNTNEIIQKANSGDVDSMMELVSFYTEQKEWNEAIDWADKAAEAGNVNGMYKAANLHSLRMSSLLSGGMPFWGVMKEDAQAIQKNAGVLLSACRNGHIDLNEDTYSHLLSLFKEALYCEAVTWYSDDTNDYERAVHLIKDIDSTREQTLLGLCQFELSQHSEAIRILTTVYNDTAYVSAKKVPAEEAIYSTAMFALSVMTRMNGDLDKAVLILNRGIDGVTDIDMKTPLQKELGRYQKKMFGGWKFS